MLQGRPLRGLVLACTVLAASAGCSSGPEGPDRLTTATADPARVQRQDAAETWLESYAGGILIVDDRQGAEHPAGIGLEPQEQRCVTRGMAEKLDQSQIDSIVAAPSADQIEPTALAQLVEIMEGCSDVHSRFYALLVAEEFDAGGAGCIAEEASKVVTWANLLLVAPLAASGQVDPNRVTAFYTNEILGAWSTCSGVPQTSLPF